MSNPNQNHYQTSSLQLATVLSLYFGIESIDKSDPRKALFTFIRTPDLDSTVQAYFNGSLRENPITVLSQLKYLKNRLYEETV